MFQLAIFLITFLSGSLRADVDFSRICRDSRNWSELGTLEEKIALSDLDLFGVATCTYQDSGLKNCPDSQWAMWETVCLPKENRSEQSANLFTLYTTQAGRNQVIQRLNKLGVNSYRFSIEWSQIEPEEGVFLEERLQVYVELCKALRQAKITPMVTLHHFSEPLWFHNKGSFEIESNIPYFVRFSEYVYQALTQEYENGLLVDLFCTINEPSVDAFSRFIRGAYSPGLIMNWERAGLFLKGALKGHNAVYCALKQQKNSSKTQIGFSHQRLAFEATNLLISPVVEYLTYLINDVILNCFRTDTFKFYIPLFCSFSEPLTLHSDFIGLQYYVRPVIGFTGSTSYYEPMTLMPFREDPEGIYEAILEVSKASKLPIIITENGISTKNPEQRRRYLERALYAISKAREDLGKESVLGYYGWCFCRNGEWELGMAPQDFGFYELSNDGILSEDPREGIEPFINVARSLPAR